MPVVGNSRKNHSSDILLFRAIFSDDSKPALKSIEFQWLAVRNADCLAVYRVFCVVERSFWSQNMLADCVSTYVCWKTFSLSHLCHVCCSFAQVQWCSGWGRDLLRGRYLEEAGNDMQRLMKFAQCNPFFCLPFHSWPLCRMQRISTPS